MHWFEIGTKQPKPLRQPCPLLAKADVLPTANSRFASRFQGIGWAVGLRKFGGKCCLGLCFIGVAVRVTLAGAWSF
jgi:hypothetical protein